MEWFGLENTLKSCGSNPQICSYILQRFCCSLYS